MLLKMRYFLYPSNVTNTILSGLAFFLQFRNVNNSQSLAVMCQGPCKFLGPEFCFHGYVAILAVATVGGCLNMHTLYYRMITIKYLDKLDWRVFIFCFFYVFPVLITILSYIPPIDIDSVYLETLAAHPDYDFTPYRKFGGFVNSHHICMTLVTLLLVFLATFAPAMGYYWRRETLKILDENYNSLSVHSVQQFKALIHGLGLQIMLPLICYVPVGFFYIFNKYSASQILISQYTLGIMITLPAILDPILQISFIVPYRNAVKRIFRCQSAAIGNTESTQMDRILNTTAAIYYPIFFIVSLTLQGLLFHLIFNKTPKMLRKMRYFLYPSNVTNIILSGLAFFLQFRNVHNTKSFAIMCQGPCKFLGPEFCFHGYVAILAAAALGGVLNLHTLFYRMITIKYHENYNWRITVFCVLYVTPILVIILSYIPPFDFDAVYQETLASHPDYDFAPYRRFGGFAEAHICNVLVTLLLLAMAVFAPMLGYYCRREALKILDKSFSSLSAQSVQQFKALIHCLGLQLLLPLICDVPVSFFYMFNKFSGSQNHMSQYTLGIMITLPAFLDPILQISFIVPYRNAVKQMFYFDLTRRLSESGTARQETVTDEQRRKSWQAANNERRNTIKPYSISNSL